MTTPDDQVNPTLDVKDLLASVAGVDADHPSEFGTSATATTTGSAAGHPDGQTR